MVHLYKQALSRLRKGEKDLARRYIEIIIDISRRTRVKPPRYIKRGFCKKCHIPLIPGLTARVRIQSEGKGSRVVVTCLECGWIKRYMIKARRQES
ncbi:MAG: ribonuclease P [Thermoprotei archaeon]|nr:MAG: ribonuclease P [Thermoprotei archaeon]